MEPSMSFETGQPRVGPLVRSISTNCAIIWAELPHACEIILNATPGDEEEATPVTARAHTITVGGRYYAAPQLLGLQPATWYTYRLNISPSEASAESPDSETNGGEGIHSLPLQCFRTLDPSAVSRQASEKQEPPLLAYGSCRKITNPQADALSAFGRWLTEHFNERESLWPRLLLLIGDQIYADQPCEALVKAYPDLRNGAQTFADFARMYEYAWTSDEGVRQVLAVLPTYMIFDDHEVTNGWNTTPTWRPQAIKHGMEQMLVDGLVAYWVYQGWGNLDAQGSSDSASNPLLQIMQKAARNGSNEDMLEALRAYILPEVRGQADSSWHYQIPTTPPIFVADVRAGRPATFAQTTSSDAPARIMSEQQMMELVSWVPTQEIPLVILVSSVPVLLPPLIGLAEYMMGIRPLFRYKGFAPLRWLSRWIGHMQQSFARRTSFDHWPLFVATWRELVKSLVSCQRDILVLSGDVHFSYAAEARRTFSRSSRRLYQFVSTPLQNTLKPKDRRLILRQSVCTRATYGGLQTTMLPLSVAKSSERIRHRLLFDNVIALVTVTLQEGSYKVQQEYLGSANGRLYGIGRTRIESRN